MECVMEFLVTAVLGGAVAALLSGRREPELQDREMTHLCALRIPLGETPRGADETVARLDAMIRRFDRASGRG
jgi:hypothetical protein